MLPTNISECSFLPIYIKRLAISALVCSLLQMVNIWIVENLYFLFFEGSSTINRLNEYERRRE